GDKMPGAKWFPDARLNFAENLLKRGDQGDAFVFWDERGFQRRVSYSNLTSDVSRAAQAITQLGLRPGDRAAAFIPNMPETGMLALAALSQGVVWSSCSPDSARSSRRSCSLPTAIAMAGASSTCWSAWRRSPKGCRRCARSWWCPN